MPALEGYDLVMIGILAGAAVIGYFKGFLWQLAWIAGIVVSSIAAIRFGGVAAPFFGQQAPWNRLLAMLAIYAASSIGVWLVFRVVSGAVTAVHLSSFDHQLGLLFGAAKGALLCIVITFFAVTLAPAYRDQIVNSRSGRLVAELIVKADAILPKDLHDIVDPFVKQFEEKMAVPAGMPQPAGAAGGPSPSPLTALLEGLGSVSAWVGADQAIQTMPPAGQGGGPSPSVQQAGGPLPPGSSWFVPATPTTASSAPPPPAPRAASAPGQFPVGSQTPLPIR
jgi:membrane protein required for colicin V production